MTLIPGLLTERRRHGRWTDQQTPNTTRPGSASVTSRRRSTPNSGDGDLLAKREAEFLLALRCLHEPVRHGTDAARTVRVVLGDAPVSVGPLRHIFRPRATKLVAGVPSENGVVGGGVCEYLPKRICTVSKRAAAPIRVREAGSKETR